jgi:cysteine sulfinate desulfinase/cysteine desulfurase-like protein
MNYAPERANRVLRFSSGWETTAADWDALLDGVLNAARELGVFAEAG